MGHTRGRSLPVARRLRWCTRSPSCWCVSTATNDGRLRGHRADGRRMSDEPWERDVLEQIARDTLDERRRARRWGIFFRLLWFGTFAALGVVLVVLLGAR